MRIAPFTARQRETLLKILLNASNAVLGGVVLGSVLGPRFRPVVFVFGMGFYTVLVIAALWLER